MFIREFNEHFYTRSHQDQKRHEFFRLRQFGKTVIEYEIKLRELYEFVPELSNSEEYLCSKFEEDLTLEIREKIFVSGGQSYKEIIQLVLRAEKLTSERMSRGKFQKIKGFGFVLGQSSKKSHSFESSNNLSGYETDSVSSPQTLRTL